MTLIPVGKQAPGVILDAANLTAPVTTAGDTSWHDLMTGAGANYGSQSVWVNIHLPGIVIGGAIAFRLVRGATVVAQWSVDSGNSSQWDGPWTVWDYDTPGGAATYKVQYNDGNQAEQINCGPGGDPSDITKTTAPGYMIVYAA